MQSVEAMRLARTLLISEVGTHYFELIGLDKQRYVLREAILTARDAYNLTDELMKEGEVTRLSVDQFRSRRLKLEEMLLANEQQISEKERAIATLLGRLPFKVKRVSFETACSYEFPTDAGIPSQLLQYRPDIKAAELELLASKSDVSAARKAFFPSIVIEETEVLTHLIWINGLLLLHPWFTISVQVSQHLYSNKILYVHYGMMRKASNASLC